MSKYKVGDIVYSSPAIAEIVKIDGEEVHLWIHGDNFNYIEVVDISSLGGIYFNIADSKMYGKLKADLDKANKLIEDIKKSCEPDISNFDPWRNIISNDPIFLEKKLESYQNLINSLCRTYVVLQGEYNLAIERQNFKNANKNLL
jgi:hypothetical protein